MDSLACGGHFNCHLMLPTSQEQQFKDLINYGFYNGQPNERNLSVFEDIIKKLGGSRGAEISLIFNNIFHNSPATYFSHRECVWDVFGFCIDADNGGPIKKGGGVRPPKGGPDPLDLPMIQECV